MSKLLKLPKNSPEFFDIRARPNPNVHISTYRRYISVTLCVYSELFRPENGQAKQAEPSNFPIENLGIQRDHFGKDLESINPYRALDNSGEDLSLVLADQDQDFYLTQVHVDQYLMQDYEDRELNPKNSDQYSVPIYVDPVLGPIFSNYSDEGWEQFLKPPNTDQMKQIEEGNVSY